MVLFKVNHAFGPHILGLCIIVPLFAFIETSSKAWGLSLKAFWKPFKLLPPCFLITQIAQDIEYFWSDSFGANWWTIDLVLIKENIENLDLLGLRHSEAIGWIFRINGGRTVQYPFATILTIMYCCIEILSSVEVDTFAGKAVNLLESSGKVQNCRYFRLHCELLNGSLLEGASHPPLHTIHRNIDLKKTKKSQKIFSRSFCLLTQALLAVEKASKVFTMSTWLLELVS